MASAWIGSTDVSGRFWCRFGGGVPAEKLLATAAVLSAFLSGFGSPLRIILEIAAALLPALLACLGGALGIVREIAFTATLLFSHFLLSRFVYKSKLDMSSYK
jgi:hypothetical protein